MTERLNETFGEKTVDHPVGDSEAMAVDEEDTSAMEMDKENGNSKRYFTSILPLYSPPLVEVLLITASFRSNFCRNVEYAVGEKEQWCLSTLGYVKAFSRQYASEVCSVIYFLLFFTIS